jgi:hypothetical protein
LEACVREAGEIRRIQHGLWERHRPGLDDSDMRRWYDHLCAQAQALLELARTARPGEAGCLCLRFCLPDQTGAAKLAVELQYADGQSQSIPAGVYKNADLSQPYFTRSFLIAADKPVVRVDVRVWGYGSLGLCWAETRSAAGQFVPYAVGNVFGQAADAGAVLTDDTRFCTLGQPEVEYPFKYFGADVCESSLSLYMKPFSF